MNAATTSGTVAPPPLHLTSRNRHLRTGDLSPRTAQSHLEAGQRPFESLYLPDR